MQVKISLNPLNMFRCVCFTWTREQPYYDNTEVVRSKTEQLPVFYISQVRNDLKKHNPETIGRRVTATDPAPFMWSHAVWLFSVGMMHYVSSRRAEVLRAPTNDGWGRISESGLGQKFMPFHS